MKLSKGTVIGTSRFTAKSSGGKYCNIYVTIEQEQDIDHSGLIAASILCDVSDMPANLKIGQKLDCVYVGNGYRLLEA